MNIENNKEDHDISSDSSWTLINDSRKGSRKNSFEKVCIDMTNGNVTKETLEQKSEDVNKQESNSDVSDTSFITFDEYSLERLAECDTTQLKIKKNRKKRKTSKTCCGDSTNLLTIAACFFIITGITLLTTLLPPNYVESAELESLQNHLTDVYEHSSDLTNENSVNSLHAALEVIDSARSTDVLNIMSQTIGNEDTCQAFPEYLNNFDKPDNISEFKIRIFSPYAKEMYNDENKALDEVKIEEKPNNKPKALLEVVKDIVKSPSMQIFVATLIQNLCLIKLINEFSKCTKMESTEKKKIEMDGTKVVKKTKKVSGTTKKKLKKTVPQEKNEIALKKKKLPKNLLPELSDRQKKNMSSVYINQSKAYENSKNECKKRIEELDIKGATAGHNHRQNIQQIKNKFQKKIFELKEQEKDNYSRSQKVNFTREKFLQRLKSDREIYLHSLRKIREERKKILDNVCHGLNLSDLGSKDASVGNYAVVLPSSYDYSQAVTEIKENTKLQYNKKLKEFNNDTFSYTPLNGENAILKQNQNDVNTKEIKNHTYKYCELKRRYLRKKAKIMHKKQAKKDATEVQDIMTNIVSQLSELTPQSTISEVTEETSFQPVVTVEDDTVEQGFEIVNKRKPRKRNLNNLYQAAFEGQSKKIKQHDARKWNKNNFDESNVSNQLLMTKQDPSRVHKTKIMHKGVL